MNVFSDPEKLIFLLDHDGFVNALKKVTNTFVLFVEIHRVASSQGTHKVIHRITIDLTEEEVKMVGHEAVSDEFNGFFVIARLAGGSVDVFCI